MTNRRDKNDIRIFRVNENAPDLPGIVQAYVRPGRARVSGLIHTVAEGNLRAHIGSTRADIDRMGTRRGNSDSADGSDGLRIKYRRPGSAGIARLPDAAAD